MKQFFHKITAISLTFVVLFSTLSFTVNKHYCGDLLVDATIFGAAKSCGMEMKKNTSDKDCSLAKKNCCTEKQEVIEGQDELKTALETLRFEQQAFIVSYIHSYISLFEVLENDISSYRDYSPPLVVKDIHKLDETYLI
ncbi:MAG: hypothetical protein L3J14_00275 [Flavobacteriaceae bacterium]|nr:hypothetical protein [Flavobacteriaceae bacterium]